MSERPIDHDLDRRVRDLELAMSATAAARRNPGRRSPMRRFGVAIATVIVLATLPMITVASDRFSDVPNGHAFHDAINELWHARITGGCATNPRRYCPDQAVSRGQMAGFLTRGLGRLTWDEGGPRAGTNSIASVTVDAGEIPGGKGYVLVSARVSASVELGADEEAPASVIFLAVENAPTPFYSHEADEVGWDGAFNLFGPEAPIFEGDPEEGGYARAQGSTTEVFVVPSGESTILDLVVHIERTDPTSNVEVYGQLTALYVPFGEDAPFTP